MIGIISAHRPETRPFSDKEIVLLENFAAQAVIAIENTRLINEQREALEQQTATAEVLRVINGSPGDLAPVFEAILEKAHTLCGATIGALATYDGEFMHPVAIHGYPDDYVEQARQRYRPSPVGGQALIGGARFNHLPDMQAIQPTPLGHAGVVIERTGLRTFLAYRCVRMACSSGQITAFRTEVRPFSDKEDRTIRELRGPGRDRDGQRPAVGRVAGPYRRPGRTQHRVRRADRTSGRDDRRAEGDVCIAWRSRSRCSTSLPARRTLSCGTLDRGAVRIRWRVLFPSRESA